MGWILGVAEKAGAFFAWLWDRHQHHQDRRLEAKRYDPEAAEKTRRMAQAIAKNRIALYRAERAMLYDAIRSRRSRTGTAWIPDKVLRYAPRRDGTEG